jgi:hypothetical protein
VRLFTIIRASQLDRLPHTYSACILSLFLALFGILWSYPLAPVPIRLLTPRGSRSTRRLTRVPPPYCWYCCHSRYVCSIFFVHYVHVHRVDRRDADDCGTVTARNPTVPRSVAGTVPCAEYIG